MKSFKKYTVLSELSKQMLQKFIAGREKQLKEIIPWTRKGEYRDLAKGLRKDLELTIHKAKRKLAAMKEDKDTMDLRKFNANKDREKLVDLAEEKEEKELDDVDPKELKGKHKDREDKDIDNDGDVDKSDKFLHKRRKAISKAIAKKAK